MTQAARKNILLLDDSPEDRALYRRYLEQLDGSIHIDETAQAAAALKICRQHPPDCLLLDYRLPDMNGAQFLRQMRSSGQMLPFPVVVLTGHGSEEVAVQCLQLGAQDYLVKRLLTPASLGAAMSRAMGKYHEERERADAQRTLAQTEGVFRQVLTHAAAGMAVRSKDGEFVWANEAVGRMLGLDPERVASANAYSLLVPEDRGIAQRRAERICDGSLAHDVLELRYRSRTGGLIWVRESLSRVGLPGPAASLAVVMEDVTLSRRHALTAMEMDSRLQAFLDAMPHVVWLASPDGIITATNHPLPGASGGTESGPEPFAWFHQLFPDDRARIGNAFFTAFQRAEPVAAEARLLRAVDGTYRWHALRFVPRTDERGAVLEWIGSAVDVHDSRVGLTSGPAAQMETLVRERTSSLSMLVQQLEAEILDRRLSEQLVQNALDERDVLLREMQHRVRNNLELVSSLLAGQAAKTDAPESRQPLENVRGHVQAMAQVHDQLCRGDLEPRVKMKAYLSSLVSRVVSSFGPGSAAIRHEISIPDSLELTAGAALPCAMIVHELVTNALQHAFPAGAGRLVLSLTERGSRIHLTVSDNGKGLPDDFAFPDKPTLGIQLVRSLTRQINGRFEYQRAEPGTSFTIDFERK